ncbi:MAG: carboxypeptidase-like regulatory domain-containing protein, partial [Candidatus Woesearchaeota archaeon]|nr:carboxypeptidase-like regulatory domain-containing protein [Candidatus Woesearchaeota archaeon]
MKKSVIYLILFLIFLYFMIDIAEAACNPYTFIGGSISPSNVNTGGSYTISCDYGALIDCIVSQPGSGTCSFTGFSGSTATFSCVAGSTSGTFTGYCSTYNGFNSVSNCCGSTNSVGTLTVTSGATTTCSSLGGTCKSNSCSSYSLCSSVSGATDCSNCCYGSCTSGATTTGPYTISGRVKTSGGVGISDTQIFLNSDYNCMSYTYLPNMITGPSGDYSFTISPSDDLYKEQNGQLSLAIWYGNCDYTYDSICKPLGTVTSNTGVDFIGTLQPVYSVSGYVKYSDNTPIANAQVHLSKGCFTQPITDVYTNSQGYYSYTVYHDSTITCTYSTMCIQTGGETYGPVTFNGNIQHNFIISGTSPTTTCSSQGGTCKYPSCDSYESCNPITGTTGCSSGYLCCSGACTTPSPTTTCSSLGGTCKSSLCSNYNSCSLVSGATDCTYGYSCCSGTCTSGASTTIRGYAKTSTGTGISGVSVTASCQSFVGPFPAPIYATTSSSGYYSLTIPANWISHPCTADLYASQSGCTFSPSGYSVTLTGGTVNKDFTGTCTSTSVCTDSDNGLNYDILGTTSGIQNWAPFSQSTTTDYCWGVKDVIEFYCMNTTTYSWTNHSCPSSCSNGVCLGGSNFYNISGQVKY